MRIARNLMSYARALGWRTPLYIAALMLAAQGAAAVRAQDRELLNSERIAAAFGSYGVEIVEQDAQVRVSNLFSGVGAGRICRTFAVVRYALQIDPAIAREHAQIVSGGSIGAVFAAQGWEVRKTHLRYGERAAPAKLAALMRVDVGTSLAEHVYALDVVKDGRAVEYATLVEIHHPEYLAPADLAAIYGPAKDVDRRDLVERLLEIASQRTR
jgi:hypothetical protein